ncbi:hypothetical protein N7486_000224 [Penicillium sp. IBT 16267x]|nr:hypothetical protein N7486_000224 [Penicillium sp. IBT 16267x]
MELERIQEVTQTHIKNDQEVSVADIPLKSARQIEGLRATTGETYPDLTRGLLIRVFVNKLTDTVSIKDWRNYSVELC